MNFFDDTICFVLPRSQVTSLLLQFCFGSANGNVKANVQIFPNTLPLATGILASVLSPRQNFTVGPLTRSFPLLDGDAFDRSSSIDLF